MTSTYMCDLTWAVFHRSEFCYWFHVLGSRSFHAKLPLAALQRMPTPLGLLRYGMLVPRCSRSWFMLKPRKTSKKYNVDTKQGEDNTRRMYCCMYLCMSVTHTGCSQERIVPQLHINCQSSACAVIFLFRVYILFFGSFPEPGCKSECWARLSKDLSWEQRIGSAVKLSQCGAVYSSLMGCKYLSLLQPISCIHTSWWHCICEAMVRL